MTFSDKVRASIDRRFAAFWDAEFVPMADLDGVVLAANAREVCSAVYAAGVNAGIEIVAEVEEEARR